MFEPKKQLSQAVTGDLFIWLCVVEDVRTVLLALVKLSSPFIGILRMCLRQKLTE